MTRRSMSLAAVLVGVLALSGPRATARTGSGPATPGAPPAATAIAAPSAIDPAYLRLLRWRSARPSRGGRVVAVASNPVNKATFFQGATGGGVWKTEDGGLNWRNVSDGFFGTGSVGAIAVAPSNPNIVYVGMGEACIRGNASHGDGVHKSVDGGSIWTKLGLEATRQIARVRVHPTNPDIVYVAALGDPWEQDNKPYLYKTADYGKTWTRITTGIPDHDFTRVLRADPRRRGFALRGRGAAEDVRTITLEPGPVEADVGHHRRACARR